MCAILLQAALAEAKENVLGCGGAGTCVGIPKDSDFPKRAQEAYDTKGVDGLWEMADAEATAGLSAGKAFQAAYADPSIRDVYLTVTKSIVGPCVQKSAAAVKADSSKVAPFIAAKCIEDAIVSQGVSANYAGAIKAIATAYRSSGGHEVQMRALLAAVQKKDPGFASNPRFKAIKQKWGEAGDAFSPPKTLPPLATAGPAGGSGASGATGLVKVKDGTDSTNQVGKKGGTEQGKADAPNVNTKAGNTGGTPGAAPGAKTDGSGTNPNVTSSPNNDFKIPSPYPGQAEPPVDCPVGAGGCGDAASGSPGVPKGLEAAVRTQIPKLKCKAAKALYGTQMLAYFKQLVIRAKSKDVFESQVSQAVAACSAGAKKGRPKKFMEDVDAIKQHPVCQKELEAAGKAMSEGALAAWSSSKPSPEDLKKQHRDGAVAAAARLAQLVGDIALLRKDFNQPPPGLADKFPSFLPGQTAVKLLDASITGFREMAAGNADRPCSNINSFGWGGPWVPSIDSAEADDPPGKGKPSKLSQADQWLLYNRGLLKKGDAHVATNTQQRCKVKTYLMDSAIAEMASLLARYPELGEKVSHDDGAKFVYQDLTELKSGDEKKKRLDELLDKDQADDKGSLARMRENFSAICNDPITAGEQVFLDDQLLAAFMSCGGHAPLPASAETTPPDAKEVQECQDLRGQAGLACMIRRNLKNTDAARIAAFGTLTMGLDIFGAMGMGGGVLSGIVQKTLLADIAAQFTLKNAGAFVFNTAINAATGYSGYKDAQIAAMQATGTYYAGQSPVEAYQATMASADAAKSAFITDLISGSLVGHALGGGGGGGEHPPILEGALGKEYETVAKMPETTPAEVQAKADAAKALAAKMRAEVAKRAADLHLDPEQVAKLSDQEIGMIAALEQTKKLDAPTKAQLEAALKACGSDSACKIAAINRIALNVDSALPPKPEAPVNAEAPKVEPPKAPPPGKKVTVVLDGLPVEMEAAKARALVEQGKATWPEGSPEAKGAAIKKTEADVSGVYAGDAPTRDATIKALEDWKNKPGAGDPPEVHPGKEKGKKLEAEAKAKNDAFKKKLQGEPRIDGGTVVMDDLPMAGTPKGAEGGVQIIHANNPAVIHELAGGRGKASGVRVIEVGTGTGAGEHYVFRPLEGYGGRDQSGAVRKTLAAAKLNEEMGLSTVPKAQKAVFKAKMMVDGHLVEVELPGVKSEYAPGSADKFGQGLPKADAKARADAQAFEFLVGNADATGHNYRITDSGQVKVFDHDMAFKTDLNIQNGSSIGNHLPAKYSNQFIDSLEKMDGAELRKKYGDSLSPAEIDAMLFRRDVILQDIKARGSAARLGY